MMKTFYDQLGINYSETILPCGLKIINLQKKGFIKKFVALGVKFGSIDYLYELSGKKIESIPGIAHFIEHKLFEMPDESDAFTKLSAIGADANAYTATDITSYFFTTIKDIKEPIEILLDFVFTPAFNKKSTEKEKGIIISEINMYEDYPDYVLENELMKHMYPNTTLAANISGSIDDVMKITSEDLLNDYKAFYQPQNMSLVISGDYDVDKINDFIEKVLGKYTFIKKNISRVNGIKNSVPNTDSFIIKKKILSEKFCLGIRLEDLYELNISEYKLQLGIDIIFEIYFGEGSKYYQDMLERELISNEFNFYFNNSKYYFNVFMMSESKSPDIAISEIKNILRNLNIDEITSEKFENFKRMTLGQTIMLFDNIADLGEMILRYDNMDYDFLKRISAIEEITLHEIEEIINKIKNINVISGKMIE